MSRKTLFRTLLILLVVLCNIGCDQVTKRIIRKNVAYNEKINIGDHILITKVENSGAFLSIGNSFPEITRTIIFSVLPLIFLAFGFYYILKNKSMSTAKLIGFSFVIGGGFGNIFDRIIYGSVTDFMHVGFPWFRTGIFNMADVSITIGVLTVVIASFFNKQPAASN